MQRTALAFVALISAFGSAVAEPWQTQCAADATIPAFVTQRTELIQAAGGDSGSAPAVELERDEACYRAFGSGH